MAKRASNFTSREEDILVGLIKQKYVHIFETKKTNTTSNRMKNEAWVRLTEEFNNLSGDMYRDLDTLRVKYMNLKKRCKQKFGNRLAKLLQDTPIDTSFQQIVDTRMTDLSSEFDNGVDVKAMINEENVPLTLEIKEERETEKVEVDWSSSLNPTSFLPHDDSVMDERSDENMATTSVVSPAVSESDDTDWSSYAPNQIRIPVTTSLKRKRKCEDGSFNSKLEPWAAAKTNVAAITEKCLLEEHSLKLKLMEESYRRKFKRDEEKHQLEIKQMREIHELEMKKVTLETDVLILKLENFQQKKI